MSRKLASIALLGLLLASAVDAVPPAGGGYVITKSTIDNGGGVSTGGDFVLSGTIGQPDAENQLTSVGGYQLAPGFWGYISAVVADLIFKDGFE